jgi:tyrosyl-tRNA synthetase
VIEIPRAELEAGIAAYELLRRTGLAASNGEARRLIKGGGARLNDAVIEDENRKITAADLDAEGVVKLSFGKKKHVVVRAR